MEADRQWVALSEASAVLGRAKITLADASRRLGIEWRKRGYQGRSYCTREDFLTLQSWSEAHPPKRPGRPKRNVEADEDGRETWTLSTEEMKRRVAAASRFKHRYYGLFEVTEADIQVELAAMASQQ